MSQRRWEQWVGPEIARLLWEAKKRLKTAWDWDQDDPSSYPINTSYALAEIQTSLSRKPSNKKIRLRMPTAPTSLAELVPEKLVKHIWEEHHSGTFGDAIRKAADVNFKEPKKSWRAFQEIIRAMQTAYLVACVGVELLPKPKINILHRGLDQIAKAAGLGAQTREGFAEFLDDLCPCGLKRHREAVRKLSSRSPQVGRPKA